MTDEVTTVGGASGGELTSFALKMLAIVGMTANHTAYVFGPLLPTPVVCILFGLGGITFPVMAFLLVEGYRHTSDVRRYALRLGLFALISQVPFTLVFGFDGLEGSLNVLFTLLISLAMLYLHDHMENRPAFWGVFCLAALASLLCDWGFLGPIMVLICHRERDAHRAVLLPTMLAALATGLPVLVEMLVPGQFITMLPGVLYSLGCLAAGFLLTRYRGHRGRPLKWFFYAYYPLHIAVLGLVYQLLVR